MTICSICGKPVAKDNPILHENGTATHVKCMPRVDEKLSEVTRSYAPTLEDGGYSGGRKVEVPAPARAADDPDPLPFWKPKD